MTRRKGTAALDAAILEIADDAHRSGVMSSDTHAKITLRQQAGRTAAALTPLTGDDIRVLRERAQMSQAVFAKYLNLTTGYVSKLERGAERPAGPALVLLNIIRRKGIEAIL